MLEELEGRALPSASSPILLDLGNAISPVQQGYTQVPLVKYSPDLGFGWTTLKEVRAADQGSRTDDLQRDFHFGRTEGTFLVDVPNGTYDVTAVMGVRWKNFDQVDLYAQGQKVASNLTSAVSEFLRPTFRVNVTDGQLNLRIVDTGGQTQYFVLNGLEIRPVDVTPPTISINNVSVTEGNSGTTLATFTVSLSHAYTDAVTVDYATADGSATLRDNDYVQTSGTLTFAPGETSRTFSVAVNGDLHAEGNEDFVVNLSHATNATIDQAQGRATIVDDENLSNTIVIDDSWLSAHGSGSYLLDQAGMTYVLHNDLRTAGTAFVVAAANVTLDLNGHSVTFGDASPVTVTNGGFETGSGRDVPGWDLSGAPSAQLASNTTYLFGNQVLRLSNFSTAQRIVSDPIAIPTIGHTYTATITPAGVNARSTVQLTVIDAVTGAILGTGTSAQTARGFSAVVTFTAATTHAVRLQVDVTPPAGVTDTLDLDQATLTASNDYGIVASRAWGGDIPGFDNLSTEAKSAYKKAANFTVKNGLILQGQGDGYGSTPLYFRSLPGVTVDHVETLATGMDSQSLDATYATGAVTVTNSTFREQIDNISNRMHNYATLKLNNISGTITIENNHLLGSPQIGIMMAANDPQYQVFIRNNEFRSDTVVTNGYAIVLSSVQNFEIANNTIIATSGRGIDLDGYAKALLGHGTVHDNYVDVQENINREYPSGLDATGLRLRNTIDSMGPHADVTISSNTIIARTGSGQLGQAYGVRISYTNINGEMNNAGIALVNNTIKAIVTTTDTTYRAKALVIDRMDAGINMRIANNVLESNDTALALTDSSGSVYGVDLVSNTLKKSTEGPARTFTGILAGYYTREIHDVRIIDTRLAGGATGDIVWSGTGVKDLSVGWLVNVHVTDTLGNPLAGASVQLQDNTGATIYSGTTDANGSASNIVVISTVYRQTTTDRTKITAESRGPQVLVVTVNGTTTTRQTLDITESMDLSVTV